MTLMLNCPFKAGQGMITGCCLGFPLLMITWKFLYTSSLETKTFSSSSLPEYYLCVLCILSCVFCAYYLVRSVHTILCYRLLLTLYSLVPLMMVEPAGPLLSQRPRRTIQHCVLSYIVQKEGNSGLGNYRGYASLTRVVEDNSVLSKDRNTKV